MHAIALLVGALLLPAQTMARNFFARQASASLYGQCGGSGFGDENCPDGAFCSTINDYYAQCTPNAASEDGYGSSTDSGATYSTEVVRLTLTQITTIPRTYTTVQTVVRTSTVTTAVVTTVVGVQTITEIVQVTPTPPPAKTVTVLVTKSRTSAPGTIYVTETVTVGK